MLKNKKKSKRVALDREDVRYVIYCRKSRDEASSGQKQSLLDQLKACIDYKEQRSGIHFAHHNELTDEFFRDPSYHRRVAECQTPYEKEILQKANWYFYVIEQASAKEPNNRPMRSKLIELVKKGKINGIISYAPDRQARNLVESGELIQLIDKWYLDVQYTNFTFENNESGRMILGINFVISYNYSDNLSKVTTRGKKGVNERWQADGKHKHWYVINDEKYHEPDPKFFDVWKEAFRRKIYEDPSDEEIRKFIVASGYKRKYKKDNKETELNQKALYKIRVDDFYYWKLISGDNETDLRDSNPYYERMITEEEHLILLDRHHKRNPISLKTYKPKDEYDEVMPFPNKFILSEDGQGLTFNMPNKWRFLKKLQELQAKKSNATLKDAVEPHQFSYKNEKVKIDGKQLSIDGETLIKTVYNYLKQNFHIDEEKYTQYRDYQLTQYDRIVKQSKEKIRTLQTQLNNLSSLRDTFIRDCMANSSLTKDEHQERIYQQEIKRYDEKIEYLELEIKKLWINQRNTILELDWFLQCLWKLAKVYDKASYVRKRKITSLLFSNIIITHKKQVVFTPKPSLEGLFILNNQDSETRTHDLKTPSLAL